MLLFSLSLLFASPYVLSAVLSHLPQKNHLLHLAPRFSHPPFPLCFLTHHHLHFVLPSYASHSLHPCLCAWALSLPPIGAPTSCDSFSTFYEALSWVRHLFRLFLHPCVPFLSSPSSLSFWCFFVS